MSHQNWKKEIRSTKPGRKVLEKEEVEVIASVKYGGLLLSEKESKTRKPRSRREYTREEETR